MSTAIDTRKTAYEARIAELTDTTVQAEANVALEKWYAAAEAELELAGRQLAAYGNASSSRTLREAEAAAAMTARYKGELEGYLGEGATSIWDMSNGTFGA